jgi:diguanylate cyclase (GGDEF)-like protein
MNKPPWLQSAANLVLGTDPQRRRHVSHALYTFLPYVVSVGVLQHAVHLGLLDASVGNWLAWVSVVLFVTVVALVRSGWTRRFADPVLAFPHAMGSISLCMAAYLALGVHRADTTILVAQTIVLSMFRLRPIQVLILGIYAVVLLMACGIGLTLSDPVRYPATSSWAHFVVGGSALLTLSLIGKWVSDMRVRISRQARELEEAVTTVQEMATNDMLTGVLNRRVMTELAEGEVKLIERSGASMCMVLIDIDHFKQVNDRHGHQGGDAVLKTMAKLIQSQLRHVDKFARWGGEEFLLMLPNIGPADAMAALERLRAGVQAMAIVERPGLSVTFSAGLAQAKPGESLENLVERADQALYEAKRQGRNRCLAATAELASRTLPSGIPQAVLS